MFVGLEERVARAAERRAKERAAEIALELAGTYDGETVRLIGRDLRWRMTGLKR